VSQLVQLLSFLQVCHSSFSAPSGIVVGVTRAEWTTGRVIGQIASIVVPAAVAAAVTLAFMGPADPTEIGAGTSTDSLDAGTTSTAISPVGTTSAKSKATDAKLVRLLGSLKGTDPVSIAVTDLTNGTTYSYDSTGVMPTASIVKVDILAALLIEHQDAGTTMSQDETGLAEAMITESDNDAADALWATIGADDGLAAANVRLGLTETVPGTDGFWGLTTTTAADQIRLLTALTASDSPLSADSRAAVLKLMGEVDESQSWGVSAAADSGTPTPLKDGWLEMSDDDGLWALNSIGVITVDGDTLLIAVMMQHEKDYTQGIALLERAAVVAASAVL
jgi:hypothetical protein